MQGKIVVRYRDGRLLKGESPDLFPNRPSFHVREVDSPETLEVRLADLKGVFYVKDYDGDASRGARRYDIARNGLGRRIRVRFKDGEVIEGYTNGYSPDRLAFFVFPPDPEDNTDRILVVTDATADVELV